MGTKKGSFLYLIGMGMLLGIAGTKAQNVTVAGTLSAAAISGTLSPGTRASITSIGALSTLTVSGTASLGSLSVGAVTGTGIQTAGFPGGGRSKIGHGGISLATTDASIAGDDGQGYGGGGGGAYFNRTSGTQVARAGGAGKAGIIIIRQYQ